MPAAETVVPDEELVRLAQQGDREAREELARRFRRPAYLLALQLLGNRDEALDVAQDSMLRFFGSLDRFQAHRPVLPWLYRIVRNRARDHYRRRRVRKTYTVDGQVLDRQEFACDRPSPLADAERRQLQRRLWQLLGLLTPDQRDILVLRDYHDLSYAEIAETLRVPIGTVMSRLHRARKHLRRELEKDPPQWLAARARGEGHA